MASSKIGICNLALAHIGAESIRSLDETNKRARMADVFYDSSRDYLLSKFDWPFARAVMNLQQAVIPDDQALPNLYPYVIPSDCKTPRELWPAGSKNYWEVLGDFIYCRIPSASETPVILIYTKQVTDSTKFTDTFRTVLALLIAVRMAPSITQDKALTNALFSQYMAERNDAHESDANIGNTYREYDEDPNNDTFVYPDGRIAEEDWWHR